MKIKIFAFFLLFTTFCQSQKIKDWEKSLYGNESDSPSKCLYSSSTQEIFILGRNSSSEKGSINLNYSQIKLDINGNVLQENNYGTKDVCFTDIVEVDQNKLLFTGYKAVNKENKYLWIRLTDKNFNIIKDTIFLEQIVIDYPTPVVKKDNNANYVVSFITQNKEKNEYSSKIIKINSNFKILWEKNFYNEFCETKSQIGLSIEDIIIDAENNIVATGNGQPFYKATRKYLYDVFLLKIDTNGNTIWRKTISEPNKQFYSHSLVEYEDNYYITGRVIVRKDVFPNDAVDIFYAKYSKTGILKYRKTYGNEYPEVSHKIISNNDGNLYIVGYGNMENSITRKDYDNLILKIDDNGNILKQTKFGSDKSEHLYGIIKINKNQFILIGDSNFGLKRVIYRCWKIYLKTL